jgi:hypothetical protein
MSQGTSDLTAHIGKFKGRRNGRLLKLPCVTNVELVVRSDLSVLQLSHPGSIDLRPKIILQGSAAAEAYSGEKDLGSQENYSKGKLQLRNIFHQYFHARSSQISDSIASEGRTGQG